jgi:hypothetical protein
VRLLVEGFYAVLVAFAFAFGGISTGLLVLLAAVVLILGLRPIDAGRAITGCAHLATRRGRVASSS